MKTFFHCGPLPQERRKWCDQYLSALQTLLELRGVSRGGCGVLWVDADPSTSVRGLTNGHRPSPSQRLHLSTPSFPSPVQPAWWRSRQTRSGLGGVENRRTRRHLLPRPMRIVLLSEKQSCAVWKGVKRFNKFTFWSQSAEGKTPKLARNGRLPQTSGNAIDDHLRIETRQSLKPLFCSACSLVHDAAIVEQYICPDGC
jgi:hypothetical protein